MVERNTALTIALRSYLAGRLGPAKEACHDLLTDHPKDGSAHHLMGLILFSEGDTDEAISHLVTATSLIPDAVEIRTNLGMAFRVAGRPDAAAEQFNRALSLSPDDPAVMGELALSLMDLGRTEEALDTLRAAIVVAPGSATLRNSLGNAFRRLKRYEDAKRELIKALELAPDMAEAHLNMGILMRDMGDLDESIGFLTEACKLNPTNAEFAVQLGETLRKADKPEEAFLCFKEAVASDPTHAEARNNLGVSYLERSQPEDAESHLRKAIELFPRYIEAYANLAACYLDQGEPDKALTVCDSALEINPDDADSHWHRALALLTKGDYRAGFEEYEWRWHQERFYSLRRIRPGTSWKGEDLNGRSILVFAEQGFGDTLQFARYIDELTRLGATVLLEAQDKLLPLLDGLTDDYVQLYPSGSDTPETDYYAPLITAGGILERTRERPGPVAPYLQADPTRVEQWQKRLAPWSGLKVGLCWQGSTTNVWDKKRSLPLEALLPLGEIDGVTLFSLQKGPGSETAGKYPQAIVDLTAEMDTDGQAFMDTAAMMMALDVVITVDTAVAHLAGALGRPVWTLLAYAPDWRWGLSGKTTPWYSSMTLYRQPEPRDWKAVMEAVTTDLKALAEENGASETGASETEDDKN